MTSQGPCVSRREALILGGSAVAVLAFLGHGASAQELVKSDYPRKVIARLSDLVPGEALSFTYPTDDNENLLVRLGEEAGGGIGADRNIVAFNTICPHMGGYMDATTYKPAHAALGPCPLHLTTFDLSRHGMVISGHATASLPQIVLELDGDKIVATGVMGLFYGYSRNPTEA
ncbi:MAG: Rieske 2Fe-2S domain-containing protein [Pseudomonadota bacterium]